MDDLEEFLNVFFQECEERLSELQDNLALMVDGDWDAETLNAAFRAVHSVKGGAGAFALDELVEFTHVFETTMDALRSDRLEPTPQVCQVLLRASDMMSALIEAAQGNGQADRAKADRIMAELEALAEGRALESLGAGAPGEDAATDGAASAAEASAEPAPAASRAPAVEAAEAEAAADATALEEEALDEDEAPLNDLVVDVQPGPDFIRSGHDPLKLVRALKNLGSVRVEARGELPPLEEHDALEAPLAWKISLATAKTVAELEAFLTIYTMTADIAVFDETERPEAPNAAADASTSASTSTSTSTSSSTSTAARGPAEPPALAPEPADAEPAAPEPAAAEPASAPRPEAAASSDAADAPIEDAALGADAEAASAERVDAARREAPKMAAASSAQQQRVAKALRVELSRIDRLVNMVGEIVITQAVLSQNFSELEGATDIEFAHAVESLSRQVRELQESVMAIRAQPVKSVFSRMPRIVRDLCASLDKEARLVLSGEHTEVDTTVIEELAEPLTHMLRNSMDHGVETPEKREAAGKPRQGVITLSAEHRGERVRIIIEDDGAGINREKVLEKAIRNGVVSPEQSLTDEEIDMLIFHPGFSTADAVTNVSGRGVGMDVVKKKVQALGGRVSVSNTPGRGARFIITLPLTLAVLDGMTVGVGQERFILPLGSIVEAVKIDDKNIDFLPGEVKVLRYRGDWLPTICLREALNLDITPGKEDLVVVVETETDGRVAIVVDELLGQRQVVLKSLEANFKRVEGVSGATILGDGRVALIIDIPALQAMSGGGLGSAQMLQEFTL